MGKTALVFDESKFKLGKICRWGHEWNDTGLSLRYIGGSGCVACDRDRAGRAARQQRRFAELPICPVNPPEFDKARFYLGRRCLNEHEFVPGMSLRFNACGGCYQCRLDRNKTEKYKDYWRKWRAAKGDEYRQYHRDRYYSDLEKNRAIRRKAMKKRIALNPELMRAYRRSQYHQNHERSKANMRRYAHTRRAVLNEVHSTPWTNQELNDRLASFGGECVYCGAQGDLTLDHFVPVSKGGPNCLSNIVPACARCNSSKHNREPARWMAEQSFISKVKAKALLKRLGFDKSAESYQSPLF